jgi:hypothetical protein
MSLHNSSSNQYRRVRLESVDRSDFETMKGFLVRKIVCVKQQQHQQQHSYMVLFDTSIFSRIFLIETRTLRKHGFQIPEKYIRSTRGAFWDTERDMGLVLKCFLLRDSDHVTAAILITNGSSECLVVVLLISYLRGWVECFLQTVQKRSRSLAEYVESRESSRPLRVMDSSGVRTSRSFAGGQSISVNMKKVDESWRQSYVVDINVDLEKNVLSKDRLLVTSYQFV